MDTTYGKLSVFFENPFWVGIFERIENNRLTVCKVTFGAEPKDAEVYEFILKNYHKLKYSPAVKIKMKDQAKNPKRLQREAKKQAENAGIGTKSQQALKLMQEQNKVQRQIKSKEQIRAEKERKFDLKQQKRKEKHKGH